MPEAWLPRLVHNPCATKPLNVQNRSRRQASKCIPFNFELSVCSCARPPDRRYGYHGRGGSGMGGANRMQVRTDSSFRSPGPVRLKTAPCSDQGKRAADSGAWLRTT